MRLVIARCSVDYTGRLSAHLPLATRLLLVKADGSVLVHSDGGAYKPLNWMSAPCTRPGAGPLEGQQPHRRVHDHPHRGGPPRLLHDLGVDPGLVKDGVERHLQELLADRCSVLGEGWSLVRQEYPTDIGPVDLLCRDEQGDYVAVEIKRRGEIDGLELGRYWSASARPRRRRGVLAAQAFTQQARTLAAARGINCVPLDYDALRGMEPNTPTLFEDPRWLTAPGGRTILAGRWFARPCFP